MAILNLATGRAPDPDGLPAGLYRGASALVDVLSVVFNGILRTGEIPKGLTRIHAAPPLKEGKNPNACEFRRPISLISTAVKVLEVYITGSSEKWEIY